MASAASNLVVREAFRLGLIGAFCVAVLRPELAALPSEPLVVDAAGRLTILEARGWSFDRVVGNKRLATMQRFVETDIADLTKGASSDSPARPFRADWLSRGRFELVAVVNRIDRRAFDPRGCGEVRLVYRLALQNPKRPSTRLPMTVNVRIPQPAASGKSGCEEVARRWQSRADIDRILHDLPTPAKVEVNYQSLHVPSTTQDMDDHAQYVLRAFTFTADDLSPDTLFNTPRSDLDDVGRTRLGTWVSAHVGEIDQGTAVLPDEFLAARAISVSPRGLVHPENRPFAALLSTASFASLPLDGRAMVKTPDLLLRRLDEMTCQGCHQSRGVAGFHMLGEERDARRTFNALAVGHSPHFGDDLAFRAADLDAAAHGKPPPPRPFASHPDGRAGSDCGLSPGLAEWRCSPGLVCRDIDHGAWGVCARSPANAPGEPCEDVSLTPSARPQGWVVTASADATCPAPSLDTENEPFCAPNWLGFTGGMCSARCEKLGEVQGAAVCAALPAAGYEADCLYNHEPIERCLERHVLRAKIASCDRTHACRGDYLCARVAGAPPEIGGCVPPYFVFQARLDGPLLDR